MILLDTHVWVKWIMDGGKTLPSALVARLETEDRVCISAISCLEMAYLVRNGKIELPMPLEQWLHDSLEPAGIECLPVTCQISKNSVELPQHHKDPADRIIATALYYQASLVSLDSMFPSYKEIDGLLVS